MPYTYLNDLNQYRNDDTGELLSSEYIRAYVDEISAAGAEQVTNAVSEDMSIADFMTAMKLEIKTSTIQQYLLGRGGRSAMTQADWGSIGRMLRLQYKEMRNLQAALDEGRLSVLETRRRVRLHFAKTREAYERANAKAFGLPTLPAYPGDLTSECQAGDQCHWRIVKLDGPGNFLAFWETSPVENCTTCIDRHAAWHPLEIQHGVLQPFTMIKASPDNFVHVILSDSDGATDEQVVALIAYPAEGELIPVLSET